MIYILSCETIKNGGGIYAFDLLKNGSLEKRAYFACDRPMYGVRCEKGLCVLLRQPFENAEHSGYFFIDKNLQTVTEIKSTQGKCACHLCVDGDDIYTVNYLSGNIVRNGELVLQRQGKSIHPTRQNESHTHFVGQTFDGYLAICDLGTDSLVIYDKDLQFVSEAKAPNGYGVRHLTFSKDGKYIYAVSELVPSVSVFAYANGRAKLVDTVKIECKHEKANGAAIRLSSDGKFLYVSLREENVIRVYAVSGDTLTFLQTADCGGDSPRDFNVFGDYLVCSNERSDDVTVLRLKNGQIAELIEKFTLPAPLCVL